MRPMIAAAAYLIATLAVGCAQQPVQTPDQWKQKALPFVQDGVTTREQVLLKLGSPTAVFEGDRILTYRVARAGPDGVSVIQREHLSDPAGQNWTNAEFSLVLVFRGPLLEKHSLVPVR